MFAPTAYRPGVPVLHRSLIGFLLATFTAPASAQTTVPVATDAARCSFSFTGGPVRGAAFSRAGDVVALHSDTTLAAYHAEDCTPIAQVSHGIGRSPSPVVLVTEAGQVVVVSNDGVWAWAPGEVAVRHVHAEPTDTAAVHAGGESVIVAAMGVATLLRIDVRTGRVDRRRTLPDSDDEGGVRGIDSLGWDPSSGALLVLLNAGALYSLSARGLDHRVLLGTSPTGSERRRAILAPTGGLLHDTLRSASFAARLASPDGSSVLLESFRLYSPTPAPPRWTTWAPGRPLPTTIDGPARMEDDTGAQHAHALSSSGRVLVCRLAPSAGAEQPCWLVDL